MMSAEDQDDMKSAFKWLRDMEVELTADEDSSEESKEWQIATTSRKVIKLDKLQRYSLIKLIWRSSLYSMTEKKRLLEREKNIDNCDVDVIESFGVWSSLPDTEIKCKLFDEYV